MANNYINVDLVGLQETLTEIEVGVDDVVNRLAYAFYDNESEISIARDTMIQKLNSDFYGTTASSGVYKRRKEKGNWGTPLDNIKNFKNTSEMKMVGKNPHIIFGTEFLPSAEYYGTGKCKKYNTNLHPEVANKPDEIIKQTNERDGNNWYDNARLEIVYSPTKGYYMRINKTLDTFSKGMRNEGVNVNYILYPVDIRGDESDRKPIEQTPDYLSYNSPILRKRQWVGYDKPQKVMRYGKYVTERGFYIFTR